MAIAERWRKRPGVPADIEHRLDRLGPLPAERGVRLAYVFGSIVGRPRHANDVDLALLPAAGGDVADLYTPVAECLGTDRVDLASAPPVRGYEVVHAGRVRVSADLTLRWGSSRPHRRGRGRRRHREPYPRGGVRHLSRHLRRKPERLAGEAGDLRGALRRMRGLAGFRNVLVHRYTEIDPQLVYQDVRQGTEPLRWFGRQVGAWVDADPGMSDAGGDDGRVLGGDKASA